MQRKLKLLLVDDDADITDMMKEEADSLEIDLLVTNSGIEAVKLIALQRYDGIILDLAIPDIDGCQLAACAFVDHLNSKTPIYICSGNVTAENVARLSNLSIVEIVEKPFEPISFLKTIAHQLRPTLHTDSYPPEHSDCINAAIKSIMENYFKDAPTLIGEPFIRRDFEALGPISSAIVLFGSKVYGQIVVTGDYHFISNLAAAMFQCEPQDVDPERHKELMCELVNMIAGETKRQFQKIGESLKIGIPQPFFGHRLTIIPPVSNPRLNIPINIGPLRLHVEYCFGDPKALAAG